MRTVFMTVRCYSPVAAGRRRFAYGERMTQRRLAFAGLVALLVGIVVSVAAGISTKDATETAGSATTTATTTATRAQTTAPPPKDVRVPLRGLRGYDPEGDGREGDDTASLATDGDTATAWSTESYTSFFKKGVGLLLDGGSAVSLTRVVVTSGTPGVSASIRVGAGPDGPFAPTSPAKKLGRSTTFALDPRPARYTVVWIEEIPGGGTATIGEVRAWREGSG
jgi:hypothetical protein